MVNRHTAQEDCVVVGFYFFFRFGYREWSWGPKITNHQTHTHIYVMSSAFTKELRRREKQKQILVEEQEGKEDAEELWAQQGSNQNLFDLLNEQEMDTIQTENDDTIDDRIPSKKVSIENMKPKKKKNKKNKLVLPISEPLHLEKASKVNKKKSNKNKIDKRKEDDTFLEQEYKRAEDLKRLELEQLTSKEEDGDERLRNIDWNFIKVDLNYLNPEYEFKKVFGSRAISAATSHSTSDDYLPDAIRNNTHHKLKGGGVFTKNHVIQLVTMKPHWPHYVPLGLTCTLDKILGSSQLELYRIDDSLNDTYKNLQKYYIEAVASHDPENFVHILQKEHPYHVHTLLQLSEVYRTLYHEPDQAQDLIERALLALQHALNTTAFIKSFKEGRARLPYTSDLNCVFYHVVLSRLHMLGRSGGHATAFELCKLLFCLSSIDHSYGDPAHVLLFLDYYALRAGKYEWLVKYLLPHLNRFERTENGQMSFSLLPNLMFAKAFAYYFMDKMHDANQSLQDALIMWPMALSGIVNECIEQPQVFKWEKMTRKTIFTTQICTSQTFSKLIYISILRHAALWKNDPALLEWLRSNVGNIVEQERIGSNEFNSKQMKFVQLRKKLYLDQDILNSYSNVLEQEVMGNMLPMRSQDNVDMHARPRTEQNPIMAFLSTLLPWNEHAEQ